MQLNGIATTMQINTIATTPAKFTPVRSSGTPESTPAAAPGAPLEGGSGGIEQVGFRLLSPGRPELSITVPAEGAVIRLGRSSGNDLVLSYSQVSRHHASLRADDGELWVRDESSTNGTRVDGAPVKPGLWRALQPGQRLQVGDLTFEFQPEAPPSRPVPPTPIPVPATPPPSSMAAASRPDSSLPASSLASSASWAGLHGAVAVVGGAIAPALSLASLRELATSDQLESKVDYEQSLAGATREMASTSGVVALPQGVPTVVVPDIHGRRDLLTAVLEHEVNGEKVFDLLEQGKVNLLCLGDGMHGEARAKDRWNEASQDFAAQRPSAALDQEMLENLGTMKMVMDLKSAFPEHFHYLRGNHDEMNNPEREYGKYALPHGESLLVREWVKARMGEDFLEQYASFEDSMPLVATGNGFVASHAAPGAPLTRDEVENRDPRAFDVLAWTDNRGWQPGDGEEQVFQGNLREFGSEGDHWLVGHRLVDQGLYRGQFDDQLVQINAPSDKVVAVIGADGRFDPGRDVIELA